MKRITLLVGVVVLVVYLWYTSRREHLTPGPPTLSSLYNDTKELDEKLTKLDTEFQQMKKQASEGANAAASARLQLSAVKNS